MQNNNIVKEPFLSIQECQDLKSKLKDVLRLVNDESRNRKFVIIVKIQIIKPLQNYVNLDVPDSDYRINFGHTSQGGSFEAVYDGFGSVFDYKLDNGLDQQFRQILHRYCSLDFDDDKRGGKRTIFIRYNDRKNILEIFRTAGFTLKDKFYSSN